MPRSITTNAVTTACTPRTARRVFAVAVAVALAASACGSSENDASDTTLSPTTETTVIASTTTAPTSSSTESTAGSELPSEPVDEADLPGEPFEFGPAEGSTVAVVGVAADDVLNVRRLPDSSSEVIAELDPMGDAILTARKRDLGTSIWYEVEVPEGVGWANATFLAPIGGTRDATNEFSDLLGGLPTAASTDALIEAFLARLVAFGETQEGPPVTAIVIDGPTVGDLDEATIDMLGYADDSVRGDRLHLFIMNEGGTAAIKSIEATTICQRGSDGAYCL